MPRKKKQPRSPDRSYAFSGCVLRIYRHKESGVRYELSGARLSSVPALDRELAANALRGWLGPATTEAERIAWHEKAYSMLWENVGKAWDDKPSKERAPCPS